MNRKILAGTVALAAAIGLTACGGAAQASKPAPTVTKTHTVTRTVERTPQSCLDALDAADKAFGAAGEGFNIAANAIQHAANGDLAGLTNDTDQLNSTGTRLNGALDAYSTARDECRGGESL